VDIKNGETRSRFTMSGEVLSYIRDVEYAMVTTLFVMSSVGSSTRGLESSLEDALESVGLTVLGWVGFIGGGGFFFLCASYVVIQLCFVICTCNCSLRTLAQL
jgi:hypothetical protein